MGETWSSQPVSTRLQRIAEQEQTRPEIVFTTLAHLIDVELLRESYERTGKDSSPGVDGVSAQEYGEHLEANLNSLHQRLRDKTYYAPPVKRVYL